MLEKHYQRHWIFSVLCIFLKITGEFVAGNSLRPPIRLGAPSHLITGEHVSLNFYSSLESGDFVKNNLQSLLHNFLENLQSNLSTSSILNADVVSRPVNSELYQYQLRRLYDLAYYFEHSSEAAGNFALKAECFFEISKNESYNLLLKLRQVPSAQRFLPTAVKMHLTDYFAEMEFFHVMFSEVIDEALEYIVDTLRSIQGVFLNYADIQREVLRTWNLKSDEWCCTTYMEFLQRWSAQIFKCAADKNLYTVYDVYATTEMFTKYIMRQLEFRIQRLYNCFIFGNYQIRCQYLRKPEQDFEKLFAKLDELQQYIDIKIKKGRVSINRSRRRRHQQKLHDKCIPHGFPHSQMPNDLRTCFYLQTLNEF